MRHKIGMVIFLPHNNPKGLIQYKLPINKRNPRSHHLDNPFIFHFDPCLIKIQVYYLINLGKEILLEFLVQKSSSHKLFYITLVFYCDVGHLESVIMSDMLRCMLS